MPISYRQAQITKQLHAGFVLFCFLREVGKTPTRNSGGFRTRWMLACLEKILVYCLFMLSSFSAEGMSSTETIKYAHLCSPELARSPSPCPTEMGMTVRKESGWVHDRPVASHLILCPPAHTASLITSSAVPTPQGQAVQGQKAELKKTEVTATTPTGICLELFIRRDEWQRTCLIWLVYFMHSLLIAAETGMLNATFK